MVCYQVTLFVTKEQENAIIDLFATRNWHYRKKDNTTQPHRFFSPYSQLQGTPENVSQGQCAGVNHVDVKPEISVPSIYADPNTADTCSLLAKNYDPFRKLLDRFACANSGTEHRLISQPNQTAQSENSSSTENDTKSSKNSFPSLDTTYEKKYPYREGNETLDEAEPKTDCSSDNNLEGIEVEDHLKSNAETLKKYVEVEVKDMGLDPGEGQEGVGASNYLTDAIYESSVNPPEKDHMDLAQKSVYCVYQYQNKATILQNFSVTSHNSDKNVISLDSKYSYSESSKTKSLNQLELEREILLHNNSLRVIGDSKQNVTSDMILAGEVIDISNNLKKKKTSETEACENADNQVSIGNNSSNHLEDKKSKQVKVKNLTNKSNAKKSAYIYCSMCEHTFRIQKRYENHIKNKGCAQRHVCEFCGKIFLYGSFYEYKLHINHHKKQKDHKCHICGKLFIEKGKMNQHVKRHSCPNPVICEVCGLGFPTVTALNLHKYNMHNNNRNKVLCSKCPKTFKSKSSLFYHNRTTHSKDVIETCDICNKTFNDIKLLKAHMITHVESFDHKCDVCNAAFKRVSGLYQHKRRHKKAFSHFCKFCQKGFYERKTAEEHENLHTGAKPHVCSVCGYSCACKANLFKHMKLVHKNASFK